MSSPMLHDEIGLSGYFCMHSEGGKIFFWDDVVKKSVSHAKKRSAAASLEWSAVQGCDFSHNWNERTSLNGRQKYFVRLSVILSADIMVLVKIGVWESSYYQNRSFVVEQRSWGLPALSSLWNNWLVSLEQEQVLDFVLVAVTLLLWSMLFLMHSLLCMGFVTFRTTQVFFLANNYR